MTRSSEAAGPAAGLTDRHKLQGEVRHFPMEFVLLSLMTTMQLVISAHRDHAGRHTRISCRALLELTVCASRRPTRAP